MLFAGRIGFSDENIFNLTQSGLKKVELAPKIIKTGKSY